MKRLFTLLFVIAMMASNQSKAVVGGAIPIPTFPKFPNLAALIDSLNLYGISGGTGVTATINQTQYAPSGGYVLGSAILNPTLTGRFITLKGKGNIVYAQSGNGSTDAIFTVQGTDFVTIDSFVFKDTSTNTTATTMMERGISFVKFDQNDGCKTNTVLNCTIILNNTNTTAATGTTGPGATGIYIGNTLVSSTTALAAPTASSGAHDGFFIANNNFQNVNSGVYGFGTGVAIDGVAFNDANVTIQNNIIENFTHYGVYLTYFNNDYVSSNRLNNTNSGGVAPTTNSIYGILYNGATIATNNSWNCENNVINLTIGGTYAATGIYTQIIGSGSTVIKNDSVKLTSVGTSNQLIGIWGRNGNGNCNIENNTIYDFNSVATNSNSIAGIWNGQTSVSPYGYPTASKISNNIITDFSIQNAAGVFGCIDQNIANANPTEFIGNTIRNISITGTATSLKGYQYRSNVNPGTGLSVVLTCTKNTFRNINASASSAPITIIDPAASIYVASDLSGNKFQNITAGTGFLTGVQIDFGKSMTFNDDTFLNLSGLADVIAYKAGFANVAVPTISFTKNSIDSLASSGTSSMVAGFSMTAGTSNLIANCSISNTIIRRLIASGTNATAVAMSTAGNGTAYTLSNNILTDISAASNTSAYSSSFGVRLLNTGTNNIIFNTIRMNTAATTASGYGATALQYNSGATNTIQNNILHADVQAGSDNNVSAIRAANGSAKAAPSVAGFTASSNIYYTPTGSNNYLYVEGTTNTTLVNGYHVSGLTANSTKNIVNDTFFNSECDKSSYHLFMQTGTATREVNTFTENNLSGAAGIYSPSGLSYAEGTATDGAVSTDFTLATRPFGSSDIGALEFAGSVRPQLDITITSSTGFDTACTFNLPRLTGSIPAFFTSVSYQWYRDTSKIVGATTNSITVSPISGNFILKVYDKITGCEYASEPYRMTIVPPPPAIITYYDSLTFCESSAVVLQANKGHNYSYRWLRNGTILAGETNNHLVVDKSGDYALEVNTPLGCPTISTAQRVKVYPLPTPSISFAGPRQLTTQKYYTYQWYKNNVKIDSFSKARTYYCFDDGAYSVEVTDSNGCSAKTDVYLFTLGIGSHPMANAIKLYPNPVQNTLNIESPISLQISLSDLSGRIIAAPYTASSIDMSGLAAGMYLLSLKDQEGNLIRVEKINKVR